MLDDEFTPLSSSPFLIPFPRPHSLSPFLSLFPRPLSLPTYSVPLIFVSYFLDVRPFQSNPTIDSIPRPSMQEQRASSIYGGPAPIYGGSGSIESGPSLVAGPVVDWGTKGPGHPVMATPYGGPTIAASYGSHTTAGPTIDNTPMPPPGGPTMGGPIIPGPPMV